MANVKVFQKKVKGHGQGRMFKIFVPSRPYHKEHAC